MHMTNQKLPTAASESYFVKKKDAPAMTIEIVPYAGEGPVPFNQWSGVWQKNQTIGLLAASMANQY